MPAQAPTKTKSKSWRDLPKSKLMQHLLDNVTIPDAAWTDEKRQAGESREDFVKRLLGRESPRAKSDGQD